MIVFTICTQSYLAFAEVLAESLARSNDGLRLSVIVVDGEDGTRVEGADVVLPSYLPFESTTEFHRMATIYDVVELATALKPWAFRYFFEKGHEVVVYLDPDIRVFDDLGEIAALARQHGIVLNPHATKPLPRDGKYPNEMSLLQAGTFNLGFLGLGQNTGAFLDWWSERLRRHCINSVGQGYFVDQRWIDLVPGYFDHVLLKDPGYNVAYWNLPTRSFEEKSGRYLVDGLPLRFFHFSGFSPSTPHLLSRHQRESPRILLSEWPALKRLCRDYARELRRHGFDQHSRMAYGFDHAANGLSIDRRVRRAYHDALLREEAEGGTSSLPDPFTAEGAARLVRWLREPVSAQTPELSRYLYAVYNERADLRGAFPDVEGRDAGRFLNWAIDGVVEPPIPVEFRLSYKPRLERTSPGRGVALEPGVNLYGYVFAESGTGQIGRSIVAALQAAKIPYAVVPFTETINRQEHRFTEHGHSSAIYDTNVICVNADQVPVFLERVGAHILYDHYNVGIWAWEVDDMPEWMAKSARYFDEVWGISEYTASSLRSRLNVPVRAFPLPIVPFEPLQRSRNELGLPEGFLFLFCFDFESVFDRKNPLAVISAFRRAFPRPGDARLVLKSVNGQLHLDELERLRVAAAERPDIVIVDGYRAIDDHHAMINACDAYVSLHRAEGFGLTVAEAMSLGKPVILTDYSSTKEFTTSENSYLVSGRIINVPPETRAYPSTAHWSDPDVSVAASLMRRVYEQRDEARKIGERARRDISTLHGPDARAALLDELLKNVRLSRDLASTRVPAQAVTYESFSELSTAAMPRDGAERRAELLIGALDPLMPSRIPWLARPFRRLMLRLIRNYWVYQSRVDRALLESIRSSRENTASLLRATNDELLRRQQQLEESTSASTWALNSELRELRARLAAIKGAKAE